MTMASMALSEPRELLQPGGLYDSARMAGRRRRWVGVRLLVLSILTGCAVGHIRRPDGTTMTGLALGHTKLECCERDTSYDTDGPNLPPLRCAVIEGGSLSNNFVETISLIASAVMTFWAGGVLP